MSDLEDFLSLIWSSRPGFRCLAQRIQSKKLDKEGVPLPSMRHVWGETTADLLRKGASLLDQENVYFGVNTFRNVDPARIKGNRLGANVLDAYDCVYIDLDLNRPGKVCFSSPEEAQPAIERVQCKIGRDALVVFTGGGFHLYWVFDDTYQFSTWWSASQQILNACWEEGLLGVDAQCTRDKARVMRLPGSVHSGSGCEVTVVQWPSAALKPVYVPLPVLDANKTEREAQDQRYAQLTPQDVTAVCGHLAWLAEARPNQPHDAWLGCLSALKRVPGGYEFARAASAKGNTWDEERFEDAITSLSGCDCQSCETFSRIADENFGSAGNPCTSCPSKALALSPLRVALKLRCSDALPETPEEVPLPEGYVIKGGQLMVNADRKGLLMVAGVPVYVQATYIDPRTRHRTVLFRYQKVSGTGWEQASLPIGRAVSGKLDEINNKFVLHGPRFAEFAAAAINEYATRKRLAQQEVDTSMVNYIGWVECDDGEVRFQLGDRLIDHRGTIAFVDIPDPQSELGVFAEALRPLTKRREEEELGYRQWQQITLDFLKNPNIFLGLKVPLLMAFVAPVLRLVPREWRMAGMTVSLYSKTGSGKTFSLEAAASVWGDSQKLLPPNNISEAAFWNRLKICRSLPVFLEEVSSTKLGATPESLRDLWKSLTDGQCPARMQQNGEAREGARFSTLLLSASNTNDVDRVRTMENSADSLAAEYRVLNIEVPEVVDGGRELYAPYFRLRSLFGFAGPRWLAVACSKEFQQRLAHHMDQVPKDNFMSQARFISQLLHIAEFVASEVEAAGILKFGPNLLPWLRSSQAKILKQAREVRSVGVLESQVVAFIAENRANGLVYEVEPSASFNKRDKRLLPLGAEQTVSQVYQNGTAVWAYVQTTGDVYVHLMALGNYFRRNVKATQFRTETARFVSEGRGEYRTIRLLGDAGSVKPPTKCLYIPAQQVREWLDF